MSARGGPSPAALASWLFVGLGPCAGRLVRVDGLRGRPRLSRRASDVPHGRRIGCSYLGVCERVPPTLTRKDWARLRMGAGPFFIPHFGASKRPYRKPTNPGGRPDHQKFLGVGEI